MVDTAVLRSISVNVQFFRQHKEPIVEFFKVLTRHKIERGSKSGWPKFMGGTYPKGFFGLQIHKGNEGTVLWRNIRVKELTE